MRWNTTIKERLGGTSAETSRTSQKCYWLFFYSCIITDYSHIIPILFFSSIASRLRLPSECSSLNVTLEFIVIISDDLWCQCKSFILSFLHFSLFTIPIIFVSCLWISYNSNFVLVSILLFWNYACKNSNI